MKDIAELLLLFLFLILFVRGCSSCSKDYHNDYGMKGWGESVLYSDKFINDKYKSNTTSKNRLKSKG